MVNNKINQLLGISFPLIQSGMGGIASPDLAAAVSNAGCLGVVALYKHQPEEIPEVLKATRKLTDLPVGVNLIPEVSGERKLREQVLAVLGTSDYQTPFTFFGLPTPEICLQIKKSNLPILIQIGSLAEAIQAVQLGADILILQGIEAGGHHLGNEPLASLLEKVSELNLGLPLVAAGGISRGREFAHLITLGASGCLCGTIFTATKESAAHPIFKQKIVKSSANDTTITDVFSIGWPGRPHRVLINKTVEMARDLPSTFIGSTTILGKKYFIPRFSAAVPTILTNGEIDQMAMYCGTSCSYVEDIRSTSELIDEFKLETEEVLKSNSAQSY